MPAQQPDHVDVEVYLLVAPTWNKYYADAAGRPKLEGAKVVKATQSRPSIQREGVATKLTLRFPASSFLPLQPEAVINIQPGDTEVIIVEASNPGEGEDE